MKNTVPKHANFLNMCKMRRCGFTHVKDMLSNLQPLKPTRHQKEVLESVNSVYSITL